MKKSLQERFDDKWIPDPNSGCHLWMSCLDTRGYGYMMYVETERPKRKVRAHRISWELANKIKLTSKEMVLHRCNVRSCVNEDHLYVGDYKDNYNDTVKAGNNSPPPISFGSKNPAAKLNKKKVKEILRSNLPQRELGRKYGVAHTIIGKIKRRELWKHVKFGHKDNSPSNL